MFVLTHKLTSRKESREKVNSLPWIPKVSAQSTTCFAPKLFHPHPHFCFVAKVLETGYRKWWFTVCLPSTTSVHAVKSDAETKFLLKDSRSKRPLLHGFPVCQPGPNLTTGQRSRSQRSVIQVSHCTERCNYFNLRERSLTLKLKPCYGACHYSYLIMLILI